MGQFDKFKKSHSEGAKKKEKFKKEKRLAKAETEAFFKQKKKESKSGHMKPISVPESKADSRNKGAKPSLVSSASPLREEIVMPLNKYLAHSGICSRRDAAERIKAGEVKVNGEVQLVPGYKVLPTDEVKFNGKKISPTHQMVYILLNKPKDFITTVDDDKGRKTVMDIVKNATEERVFPVGRLDRNTTGVLLLTNDGDLAQQLTHPSFEVRKIYEVTLDKPVAKAHLEELIAGVKLEDGLVAADAAGYADGKDKSVVGIEIHSGKNRVVRRMFEHLGYDVRSLDRVMFANLTKKNVDRGKWRFLVEKEVRLLKFFNKSKRKLKPDSVELQDTPFTGKTSAAKSENKPRPTRQTERQPPKSSPGAENKGRSGSPAERIPRKRIPRK
jgi:23S rRNA pseudouridine2605 synthase